MSKNKVVFDVLANTSQYKAQMQGIEKSTTETSKAMKAAFVGSSIAIGGTLVAFAKYETQLIKVGKTADISGKELNDFGKDVVALSNKIPLSTNELLELAASAAQLGVKGKDNILKFTETVAKLGTATNITGEEGAQSIARLLNVTGEGIGTVDKFASIIVRLGNNVAATESEILSMASRVGKSTAQFEIGTTAVLGISAALKEVGIEAELGGSAIGRTFAEMQNAVFNGGAALETFASITGKSGAELKQLFQEDATGAFQIFIEALNKLPAEQVASSMETMGLKGVRLREVIGTLAKRSDILGRSLSLASDEAQRQTALDEEFGRAVVSLENSFKFMITEVTNLAASMGKDLAPAAKGLIEDITSMIKGIREFNEATGGAITTSIVMAAKVSALVITVNKLKAVLISTGVISSAMAVKMGAATAATTGYNLSAGLGVKQNKAFALSFAMVGNASKSALLAIKNFQVGIAAMVGGLLIAIDLGQKLGKVIGKLGEINSSEEDLIKTQKELNNLLAVRVKLQEKVAAGDPSAQERLDGINKEISRREGLINVLQREVDARANKGSPAEVAAVGGDTAAQDPLAQLPLSTREDEKTDQLQDNISLRLAAAQREADLFKEMEMGMTTEAIKIAEERNAQLAEIDKKKAEIDSINRDLSRTGIEESDRLLLESKKAVAEQELMLMDEKFQSTQTKTAEQEAVDMENRIAAKQILDEALTEQEILFLEEKRLRDEENRELDLEIQAIQTEEDLLFLQNKLMTEEQTKDQVRQERLKKDASAKNTALKNEVQYGKNIGKAQTFFQSEEVKGVQSTLGLIGQIKTKEGSKAGAAQKAFAMADAAIKIPQAVLGAYTSVVGIPVVGPFLAPIAAAAAGIVGAQQLSSISSSKTPSYAVGTDFVPSDTMAQIHAGEAIVPAKENQFLQSGDLILGSPDALNQGGGQGAENIININFEGANFFGNVGDNDEFINDVFDGIATGIDEGRLAGFENATLAVTG